MRFVIVAPFRSDGGYRDRNWRAARARWEPLGVPVIDADSGDDPFSRAKSRNLAAAHADPWDVAVFVDADVMLASVRQALEAAIVADRDGRMVYAHDFLTLLDPEATEMVLDGDEPAGVVSGLTRHPHTLSSALAVPRALWDTVGGYDPRFVDWGWEDLAFMAACHTLGGRTGRVTGDAYHLWHPRTRAENEDNPHHQRNWALGNRYLEAIGNQAVIRAIINERAE